TLNGQTLPISFELECVAQGASTSGNFAIASIRDDFPVVCNDSYADFRRLLNISGNDVDFAIAFRSRAKSDVIGVHADSFQNNAELFAAVLHTLQGVEIPAALGTFADCCGKVFDAVAEVVLDVLFRCNISAHKAVVIAPDVHHGVLSRLLRRGEMILSNNRHRQTRKPGTEISSSNHVRPPL